MITELWAVYLNVAWNLMHWLVWIGAVTGAFGGFLYSWQVGEAKYKVIGRVLIGALYGFLFGIYSAAAWLPNTAFLWFTLAHRMATARAREDTQ